jgi:hypothetical protein
MDTTADERAEADNMRTAVGQGSPVGLPPVVIQNCAQKYVLIEVFREDRSKHLVRGNCSARYHKDVAELTLQQLRATGTGYRVLGGGRIRAHLPEGEILIYGFSYGFPWQGEPQHELSAALVHQAYPAAHVMISNDGY